MTKAEQNRLEARCEVAMMGFVVQVHDNSEVVPMSEYIMRTLGVENPFNQNFLEDVIYRVGKETKVTHLCVNTVEDMLQICYCLKSGSTDPEEKWPDPFKTDYGTGYRCSFCYVLNLSCDWCSEFGDCFFRRSGGSLKRVS